MFKTGIYDLSQCDGDKLYSPLSKRKHIALDLYDRFDGSAADVLKFQEHVIGRVATANGSFKKTHINRFEEFDKQTRKAIQEYLPKEGGLKVHDIAVSDGRTTVPFFEMLADLQGDNLTYIASDYASHFMVLQRGGETSRIVLDREKTIIQIIYKPFVFNMVCPDHKIVYPFNHFMRAKAKAYADQLLRDYNDNMGDVHERELVLICKPCRELDETDSRFSFRLFNIVDEMEEGCDIIRAMNILNTSYFDDAAMGLIIANLRTSLNDGGFLITGSNMEGGTTVHGGIYRKVSGALELIGQSGNGSPVHDLIVSIR